MLRLYTAASEDIYTGAILCESVHLPFMPENKVLIKKTCSCALLRHCTLPYLAWRSREWGGGGNLHMPSWEEGRHLISLHDTCKIPQWEFWSGIKEGMVWTGNGRGGWEKGGGIHAEVGKDACIFPHTQKEEAKEEKWNRVRRESKLVICSGWAPPPASSKPPVREKGAT